MTRIFPQVVTQENVATLLAELHVQEPYSDDEWQTASFDFETLDLCISVCGDNGGLFPDRDRVAMVIRLLPELHGFVTRRHGGEANGDDHMLAWIDIEDDSVHLCFNGVSYNTQWEVTFRVACDGEWSYG